MNKLGFSSCFVNFSEELGRYNETKEEALAIKELVRYHSGFNVIDVCCGAGRHTVEFISLIIQHFDLTPKGIIKMLNLLRPIYQNTAAYGHFGRNHPEFTWEATNMVSSLTSSMQQEVNFIDAKDVMLLS